jgi:hypothetical protein
MLSQTPRYGLLLSSCKFSYNEASLSSLISCRNLLISWQAVTIVSSSWAIAGEISSYRLRAKTQGIAVISNAFSTWLFTFTVAYIYNVDAGNLGIKAGFIYGGGSLLFFIVSYLMVPDLRGFSTEEVDWLYEQKIPVWKIQENVGKAKEGVQAMEAHLEHEKDGSV